MKEAKTPVQEKLWKQAKATGVTTPFLEDLREVSDVSNVMRVEDLNEIYADTSDTSNQAQIQNEIANMLRSDDDVGMKRNEYDQVLNDIPEDNTQLCSRNL